MSVPPHPEPTGTTGPRDTVLAGIAREVDALRRRLDDLDPVPGRVDELGRLVAQMADTLATLAARRRPTPAPSWLLAPTDQDQVHGLVEELCAWLAAVYLRYPDGEQCLPACWLWHPEVVEELLWLMHAWCAAYQGPDASVSLAGDWHDRQRPGVVARLRKAVGSCSPERHLTRPGWPDPPGGPIAVPGLDAVGPIVGWWATRREQAPPEPAATATGISGALG